MITRREIAIMSAQLAVESQKLRSASAPELNLNGHEVAVMMPASLIRSADELLKIANRLVELVGDEPVNLAKREEASE